MGQGELEQAKTLNQERTSKTKVMSGKHRASEIEEIQAKKGIIDEETSAPCAWLIDRIVESSASQSFLLL